ncbi:GNAT family N-acetyltransferase [Lacticaseibacillus absianus]|uniref:GNAT family N-acetyltransferase n=1 Tax=Lacticaseibacillus absianus TaxID=2729623 RepID=UPI0015C7FDFE|nr:GNAT family N-acetyltransferase [Lacticaseibacillus absianus]
MNIRPYRPEDRDAWLDVRAKAYSRSQFNDQIGAEREQYPEDEFGYAQVIQLIAEVNGQLVGLIDAGVYTAERSQSDLYVQAPGTGSYIEIFAVDPGAQRQGVGRALLTACLAALRQAGADHVEIFTRSDPAANHLYQRLGAREIAHNWRVLGSRKDAASPRYHWALDHTTQELAVTATTDDRVLFRAEQPQWFTVFTEAGLAAFDIETHYLERTYFLSLH